MVARLDDTWTTQEYPLLVAIARRLQAGERAVEVTTAGQDAGLDEPQANRAATALHDAEYLVGWDVAEIGYVANVKALTERGRHEVGLWPSEELGVERLLAALDTLAANASTEDERTRWEKIRDHLGRNGAQVGWSPVTAVLTGQLPGS